MKLYKNTLIISVIVFFVCIVLSVVFEFTCISIFKAVSFLSDYMIGIACSIVVVIITTFLQFKYEQTKLLNLVLSKVRFLLFNCRLAALSFEPNDTPIKLWEYYYDKVYESAKEISHEISNIELFSKTKKETIENLQKSVLHVMLEMTTYQSRNIQDKFMCVFEKSFLKDIKDNALLLNNSDEYIANEIVKNYEEIQSELEKLN